MAEEDIDDVSAHASDSDVGPDSEPEPDLPSWMTKPAPGSARPLKADTPELVDGDAGEALLSTMTPTLGSGRIDNAMSAIGSLSMRIDSLIAATTTYRSVLSDRLTEYADLVNRLNRTQASDLDEFRKANERTVGEIRRTMSDSEDALRAVSGNTEQLVTDLGQLSDAVRTNSADGRELIDATDKLGRFVTGALDQFAERVLGELRALSESVGPELGSLRSELAVIRESIDELNERASSAPVREAMDELRGDFSGLRRAVLEWPDLEVARSEIVAMRADVSDLIEAFHQQRTSDDAAAPADAVVAIADDIAGLRDQVRELASQVAVVEAREIPAPVPSGEVSTAAIEELRDEVRALRRRIQVRAPD